MAAGITSEQLLSPNHIIKADYAHHCHIYGRGVTVAVLDSGIQPRADFLSLPDASAPSRILHFEDFVHARSLPYDDAGHGTHICGKSHLLILSVLNISELLRPVIWSF